MQPRSLAFGLAVGALLFAGSAWVQVVRAATPGNASELPRKLEATWNAHDVNGFTALFAPDATWTNMMASATTSPVRPQTEGFFKAYPDMHCVLGTHSADATVAFAEWACTGTEAASKKPLEFHAVTIDRLASDGKITDRHAYYDPAAVK